MEKKIHKCVGLIIKNRSLSVVEIEPRNNLPVITNYSKILLEEGIVENDCVILNKEGFQEAVKKLLSSGVGGPIKTNSLYVSLPEEKIFSHQINLLSEKVRDVEYVKEVAADYIPITLDQAVFDYKVIDEDPKTKTALINFVATQNSIVQPIIDILKEVKLEVTAVNVDIYCLVKSFHNCLNENEGSFLLVNMDMTRDFLAISNTKDRVYEAVLKNSREDFVEKLKALIGISSDGELRQLMINTRKGAGGLTEEQMTALRDSLKDYVAGITNRLHQLLETARFADSEEIKKIYLTGTLSPLPGIEDMLHELLPEVPVVRGVKYMEIPLEIEEDALEGIGLCLNGCLPNDKNNYNLLPEQRRDEICLKKISPKTKIASVILAILMTLLTIKTGMSAAASYLEYRMTSREIVILNEQALNPYITQQAREKQALKQSRNQILLLLQDSFPVSEIIRDLDSYNNDGISLVSFSFRDPNSGANAEVSLKAKTINRDTTEKMISALQESGHYEKVISPLSNLVGKGERFVNMTLEVNKAKSIESFAATMETETEEEPTNPANAETNAPRIPE